MLDMFTLSVMNATVVIIAGILFVAETLIRRDEGVGQLWALSFVSGIITTVSYAFWAAGAGWIAVAIGNGAFVCTMGFMWLGCRAYNGHSLRTASIVSIGIALVEFVLVLAAGPDGGDWAGAPFMYLAVGVLSIAAAIETVRGVMARSRTPLTLGVALVAVAIYCFVSVIILVTNGSDSAVFAAWFSSIPSSFVTVAFTIVAVVIASVLRAGRAGMRGYENLSTEVHDDHILPAKIFLAGVTDVVERAEWTNATIAVISVRVDDLPAISRAFGQDVGRAVGTSVRGAVRRSVSPLALIGDDGPTALLVCTIVSSTADARREATAASAEIFEVLRGIEDSIIPVVGIGIALSDAAGYNVALLCGAAREAASRSATSVDTTVVFSDVGTNTSSIPLLRADEISGL